MSCARLPSATADRGCAESRGQGGDRLTAKRRVKARSLPVLHNFAPEHQPHAGYLDTVSGPDHVSKERSGGGWGGRHKPRLPGKSLFGGRARTTPEDRQALLANSGGETPLQHGHRRTLLHYRSGTRFGKHCVRLRPPCRYERLTPAAR